MEPFCSYHVSPNTRGYMVLIGFEPWEEGEDKTTVLKSRRDIMKRKGDYLVLVLDVCQTS